MLTTRDGSTPLRAGWIVAAIAFAIPLGLVAVQDLQIRPDTTLRLAADDPIRRLADARRELLSHPESLLATWSGSTCDDPRIPQFAETLLGTTDADGVRRGGAPEIASVTTPLDMVGRLTAQDIEPEEALRRLAGTYIGHGGLKIALTDAGRQSQSATTERLVRAVREKFGIELHVSGPVESWPADDASGQAGMTPTIDAHDLQITWDGFHPQSTNAAQIRSLALSLTDFATPAEPEGRDLIQECFLAPGSPVGIRIELSEAGSADVAAALAAIDRAAAAADIPCVHVVGEPLHRAERSLAQRRAFWNASAPPWKLNKSSLPLLAALVATALACYALRSVRRGLVLVAVVAAVGLLGIAALRPVGSQVDALLFASPLLACLLMLSGGFAITQDQSGPNAGAGGLRAFRLAMIIAALVMMPLMISSTPLVRQIGMFAAAGVALALLMGSIVLPRLLPPADGKEPVLTTVNGRWLAIAGFVSQRPLLTGTLCGLALLAGAGATGRLKLESGDVRVHLPDSRLASDIRFVEDNLTGASSLDIIVRFNATSEGGIRFLERAEIVRAAEQAALKHPAVVGALSLADLLPVTAPPPANAPTRTRVTFNRRSNEVEKLVHDGAIPGAENLLDKTDSDAADATSGVTSEQWRIAAQVLLPEGASVLQVTEELNAAIQQVLRAHPEARHHIAGEAVFADGARRVVIRSLLKTTGLAVVVLMIALISLLRSPAAMPVGLLVNVLPVAAALGLAALKGLRIDESALTVALVGLVVGAQGAVLLLARFRDGIRQGESHTLAARRALLQCGPAGVRFAMVALGALFMLGRSDLAALAQIAGLLAGMIAAVQLATLVLLPALLSGRIGRWLEHALRLPPAPGSKSGNEEPPSPHVRFEAAVRDVVRSAV